MKMDMKVRSLSVVLNRPDYEVACAAVRGFTSTLRTTEGNFSIEGCLGSFSLKDLTEQGTLYRDRFLSRGTNVLTFHFFKYGDEDPDLKR